jgi:hypothetical protein
MAEVTLTRPQHEFIFSDAKFPALIGGLGSGKSQAGTYRVAVLMLGEPGANCAYYFPTYDLINLRGIPGLVKDLETLGVKNYTVNKSSYSVSINGFGDVIFRSYDAPERIVAYEVAHSIVDELDTLPRDKAEFVWRKVVERNRQPSQHHAGNTVGCVTTPDQGQLGFVFEKWGGVELQDGYQLIKASTYSNPFLPNSYIDDILKNYNEDLAKLYLEGEFVSLAHRCVFDMKQMQSAALNCWSPVKRMSYESKKWIERDDGELRVWFDPSPGKRYVLGADVAEGLAHGDYSCADVLELPDGIQVAQWHGHCAPDRFGEIIYWLAMRYSRAFVGVENNNHGLTTLTKLRDMNYPDLYAQRVIDDRGSDSKETKKLGWKTTSKSKYKIIDQLAAELREKTHGLSCTETVREMMTYIVNENGGYEAQLGCYDDRVMARAIAGEMLMASPSYKGA